MTSPGAANVGLNVRTYASFAELPAAAADLLDPARSPSYFLTRPWLEAMAEHCFDGETRLRIYVVEASSDDQVLAVLPMRTPAGGNGSTFRGTVPTRSLAAVANYQTSLFEPVLGCPPGQGARPLTALARALAAERRRWSAIEVPFLRAEAATTTMWIDALRDAGFGVSLRPLPASRYEITEGMSFDEYLGERSYNFRKILRRRMRRLLAPPLAGSLEVVSHAEDVNDAWSECRSVHERSWRDPEPFPRFVDQVVAAAARSGAARLALAHVGDELAAYDLAFVSGSLASVWKTAYDERFSDFGVGAVASGALVRHLIDVDRVREFDLGMGDPPYKRTWCSRSRPMVSVVAFPRWSPSAAAVRLRDRIVREVGRLHGGLERLSGRFGWWH